MSTKRSCLLVIDACVAQSAGMTEHPLSSSCRETLEMVRRICHRVVMSPAILDEWKRHESGFALKWRGSMVAKKKVHRTEEGRLDPSVDDIEGLSAREHEALRKDLHLIEAAFDADGIIVTCDDELRRIWDKCGGQFGMPTPIRWINPVTDRGSLERLS